MTKFELAARRSNRPKISRTVLSTALLWVALIVVGVIIYDKTFPAPAPAEAAAAQSTLQGRATAIDGDGLKIGDHEIRLHGIDAFEYDQTCGLYACGQASKAHLAQLIADQAITCWARDTDRYGRIVAICKAGSKDIGAEQVRSGLALAYSRYSDIYVPLEKAARDQRRGAWAYGFSRPENHRHN
ncbi:thermonuclease family protein [Asticcacaulis sp. ZE23SCel15]|uniref:thermonuclease family protein n=1 Tax=Asticcacaulis sp. ZE23SCel15 TaxID=3059027 RepID=UPI00265E98DF|nr:thermonuclease family protein [Asticcacaulis sp. ZE23SCel15]WKL57437.1 thermonuclease family protein [Asticcacaulis sp. ZE23SCel15]